MLCIKLCFTVVLLVVRIPWYVNAHCTLVGKRKLARKRETTTRDCWFSCLYISVKFLLVLFFVDGDGDDDGCVLVPNLKKTWFNVMLQSTVLYNRDFKQGGGNDTHAIKHLFSSVDIISIVIILDQVYIHTLR